MIVAGFDNLGTFGKFCSVIVALGLIANMVAPVYSSGIDFQILGRYSSMVPRFIWNTFGVIVFAVCALAGRDSLSAIFTNFLALMGYWVSLWIAITLEEQLIFRRRMNPSYVWSDWNKPGKLPIGLAALIAFLVGWVGAILCMAQFYYIGPLAKLVGDYGGDMGNYVGFAWAALVYPPSAILGAEEIRQIDSPRWLVRRAERIDLGHTALDAYSTLVFEGDIGANEKSYAGYEIWRALRRS